jgi:hypothetical protein
VIGVTLSTTVVLQSTRMTIDPELLAEITVDRLAFGALDRLFRAYARATKGGTT